MEVDLTWRSVDRNNAVYYVQGGMVFVSKEYLKKDRHHTIPQVALALSGSYTIAGARPIITKKNDRDCGHYK